MRIILIFVVIFFVFLAFFGNTNTQISNPFVAYIFFVLKKMIEYFPYFLILFCILFLFLIKPFLSRRHLSLKIIFHTLLQIASIFLIGIFSSFVILSTVALIELNIFSAIVNHNPKTLGVKSDIQEILNSIAENNEPPIIITNDIDSENEIVAIAKASSGTNNFYGNKILSGIPNILILPINNNSSLFLIDNVLVVKRIDENDMQKISPLIGYQIIKSYFPSIYIKSNPQVTVLNKDSYKDFRDKDVQKKLIRVELEINKTDSAVSSMSAEIETLKTKIVDAGLQKKIILKQRDDEYNKCLSEGTYSKNKFLPKNTEEFCQEIIKKWDEEFKNAENNEKKLTQTLSENEKLIREYRFYNNYFKAQKQLIDLSTNNIPSELGVFEPPKSIKIIVNNASSTSIADYFESLSHEYLHFASYNSSKRLESSFFEESLTEYFARQAIKSTLGKDTNLGYPVSVKVIEEISKKISDPELTEIYFNKDQKGLEEKINLVYGEDFYRKNIVLFETLQFTQNRKEALKIANSIMDKIDASPITEKDLVSTESSL